MYVNFTVSGNERVSRFLSSLHNNRKSTFWSNLLSSVVCNDNTQLRSDRFLGGCQQQIKWSGFLWC